MRIRQHSPEWKHIARLHSLLAEAQDNTHNSLQKNRTRLLDIAYRYLPLNARGQRSS